MSLVYGPHHGHVFTSAGQYGQRNTGSTSGRKAEKKNCQFETNLKLGVTSLLLTFEKVYAGCVRIEAKGLPEHHHLVS